MSMTIAPLRPGFAGEVSGIDLTRPLTKTQVAAIEAGMDHYAVLVFHDQHFDDDTQLAFSQNFGELEISSGGEMSRPEVAVSVRPYQHDRRLAGAGGAGLHFHALHGVERWSIRVTGNWRITFGWDGADAVDVDLEDDH